MKEGLEKMKLMHEMEGNNKKISMREEKRFLLTIVAMCSE